MKTQIDCECCKRSEIIIHLVDEIAQLKKELDAALGNGAFELDYVRCRWCGDRFQVEPDERVDACIPCSWKHPL